MKRMIEGASTKQTSDAKVIKIAMAKFESCRSGKKSPKTCVRDLAIQLYPLLRTLFFRKLL
ncbi:hypothetical protein PAECIP111802_02109 [Paenibacillus allorhizosphaerae]|uniref:Uncharacterized protein n=1 Tax=Paenibacillus allorhizosphaerae TaxID=2849866 RepID=A0ABM8VFJ4_9BACL|nr:hypothetical protein PAECIP111802_02109 [Paenibacillus allorhizosphaerae]